MRIPRWKFVWVLAVLVFALAGARIEPARAAGAAADVAAMMQAAQHQFGSGNYSGAIATLQMVISQNPLSGEAFYWLGRCYYEIRDFDHAIMHAEKSVALDPKNSVYQDWLGRAYGGKAERDKSFFMARKVKKQFEQAVQLDPSNVTARRDLAEFCMQAPWIVGGSTQEAQTQVSAIAAIDPVQGHLARAAFDQEALKRFDLAEGEYREMLVAKPTTPDPYFEAAGFFRTQGKFGDMDATIDAAEKVSASDPRLAFYRGVGLVAADKDLSRADEYLKAYIASTPDRSDWPSHAGAREWLGKLYEAQGKRAEAAEQYRAALRLDPGRKEAQARLAKLENGSR